MRKAILNKKDQVLHKLILFEAMNSSSVMNKFIDHESLLNMFKNMGYKNGPIFMQGFVYNNDFYFFRNEIKCQCFGISRWLQR